MSTISLSMPRSLFIFRNAKTENHQSLDADSSLRDLDIVKNQSRVSLGGRMIGGLTTATGQVKSRRESVKTKENQSQGSKETSNLEYIHYFMYNRIYLNLFQKAFQKDGQIPQPVSQ